MTDDEVLLAEVRDLLGRADPVPPQVVAAARDSFGWRTLDADLARLVADSLLTAAGVRGGAARLLTYQAGDVTIEIEVTEVNGRLRVLGQVVPPVVATVRAEQPSGGTEVAADALGRFTIADLAPGLTRFLCTAEGSAPVRTEWTSL